MIDPRDFRLNDQHVQPLMTYIEQMRADGLIVPNVDPDNGGVNANALFLLESPGPKAVGTMYVSRNNPAPSAQNIGKALDAAGFRSSDILLWNVVPQCISTVDQNKRVSYTQIAEAVPHTQAFIDLLPSLKVVILCGGSAKKVEKSLHLQPHVRLLKTYHPGAQSYNREPQRDDIHAIFAEAKSLISQAL